MPKEAHARLNARHQVGEASSFAHEFTAPVPPVSHARGCIVRQHNIYGALTGLLCQALYFIVRKMSPRVTTKLNRLALVVGRAVAATNAAYANRLCTVNDQVDRLTVRQISEIGQHLRSSLRVEPLKVLVIALDEYGPAGRRTLSFEPGRKVPGTIMIARPFVDLGRVWPDAEVARLVTSSNIGVGRHNRILSAAAARAEAHF
jgi:hypothetical protein